MKQFLFVFVFALLLTSGFFGYWLRPKVDQDFYAKNVYGWVENACLYDGDIQVKAKLDTGAKTSSAFAKNISFFNREGQNWVRFQLVGEDNKLSPEIKKPVVRMVRIKRHSGRHQRRAVVKLELGLGVTRKIVEVTLANRSEFIYPVLIGRNFLKNIGPISAKKTFQIEQDCQN